MREFLEVYAFVFKWQFTNPWFYVWLVFGVIMGWPNKKKVLAWLAVSVACMPLLVMVLKWSELFGSR